MSRFTSNTVQIGWSFFFFQAEDGIRDLVRSRGLGDVYKRQLDSWAGYEAPRERMLSRLGGLDNCVVLTGDEHQNLSLIHI